MPIQVFSDLFLPNSVISSGVRGKNMRQNTRTRTQGGFEQINVNWTKTLRQYEIGTVPMKISQWRDIETLHEITEGGAFGFLMEDPKDNTVTQATGLVGLPAPVNGVVPAGLQLYKRSIDARSQRYKDRAITRPQLTTFTLYQNGTAVLPGSYTLDPVKGLLAIGADPASLTWTGKFYVPVHFLDDFIDWDLIAPGGVDQRFLAGPSVVLQEVRE